MEPTRPLGVQWPSVRALKKIDEQGLFADFRRQHLEMEIRLNGQKIRTGVAGGQRERKVKRKVLKEERRIEKRPLSRLQTDNGHSVQTRCRKTSRKLSDGSYFIDLYSYAYMCRLCGFSVYRTN